MRIYRGRIEPTAREIVSALLKARYIEVDQSQLDEVYKDVEAVMFEYMRVEREITERAKDLAARQGLDYGAITKLKRSLAKDKRIGIEDDGLEYIVKQTIEALENSGFVDEIFGEDHDLNRVIAPVFKKTMTQEEDLDLEVRKKLKHLEDSEGTRSWELEYQRLREDIIRLKKLD